MNSRSVSRTRRPAPSGRPARAAPLPSGPASRPLARSRWRAPGGPGWPWRPSGPPRPRGRTACSPTRWPGRSRRPAGWIPRRRPGTAGPPRSGSGWSAGPCSSTTCWPGPASRAAARLCCSGPGSMPGRSGCPGRQAPAASSWTRPASSAPRTRCSPQRTPHPAVNASWSPATCAATGRPRCAPRAWTRPGRPRGSPRGCWSTWPPRRWTGCWPGSPGSRPRAAGWG